MGRKQLERSADTLDNASGTVLYFPLQCSTVMVNSCRLSAQLMGLVLASSYISKRSDLLQERTSSLPPTDMKVT